MRTAAAIIGASLVVAVATGCGDSHVLEPTAPSPAILIGSQRFVTESRLVQGFTSIAVEAGGRAVIRQSGDESLEITAEDNIIPLVESRVVNGRLTLGFRTGSGSMRTHGVVYRIGVRALRDVNGSGGSQIELDGFEAPHFSVSLAGGCVLNGSGSVERLDVELSGASRIHAPELKSRIANARLSGASVALFRVSESLVVSASGASVLEFLGDPAVQSETSGASIVRRAGS
jgi:putative autotransporter adhesin-like protein